MTLVVGDDFYDTAASDTNARISCSQINTDDSSILGMGLLSLCRSSERKEGEEGEYEKRDGGENVARLALLKLPSAKR